MGGKVVLNLLALLALALREEISTKVQILTPEALRAMHHLAQFTCFTCTQVQILTPKASFFAAYADVHHAPPCERGCGRL